MKEPVSPAFAVKDGGSSAGQHEKILAMVQIALFTAIIAVCSWIQIPLVVPFTLQTFGVFCALAILGGKSGTISVLLYIVLGTIGVPVFAGFSGGIGKLVGVTGGYIVGFLASALVMWAMEALLGKKKWVLALSMVIGLLVCYAFGTAWFMVLYTSSKGAITLGAVLGMCVIPYIIPDVIKIAVALLLTNILKRFVK